MTGAVLAGSAARRMRQVTLRRPSVHGYYEDVFWIDRFAIIDGPDRKNGGQLISLPYLDGVRWAQFPSARSDHAAAV